MPNYQPNIQQEPQPPQERYINFIDSNQYLMVQFNHKER